MPVLTDDLTFQLGATGVLLNGNSATPFVDITKATGFDSGPVRSTLRDHEGDDGSFMDAEFETGRNVILEGTVYADGNLLENYLDLLKGNWAPSKTLIPLYVKSPGQTERFLSVKPLGLRYDWDTQRRIGAVDVQCNAYAEDPRIYTDVLNTTTINLGATILTGRSYNKSYNFGYGGLSTTADGVYVTTNGNRLTPPVFRIYGPCTNPVILNDTLSLEMDFNIVLASTDYLEIIPQYKTVRLNSTTNRRNTLVAPNWFYLDPMQGPNFIRYRAQSSDPTSYLQIQWRDAWR